MGMQRIKALTRDDVLNMISLRQQGKSLSEVAEIYNVTKSTISRRISEEIGRREKQISLSHCAKCIDDCLNCKKPDCDYNGRVQPHEKIKCVNALTVDMFVNMLKIN